MRSCPSDPDLMGACTPERHKYKLGRAAFSLASATSKPNHCFRRYYGISCMHECVMNATVPPPYAYHVHHAHKSTRILNRTITHTYHYGTPHMHMSTKGSTNVQLQLSTAYNTSTLRALALPLNPESPGPRFSGPDHYTTEPILPLLVCSFGTCQVHCDRVFLPCVPPCTPCAQVTLEPL